MLNLNIINKYRRYEREGTKAPFVFFKKNEDLYVLSDETREM